MSVQKPIFIPSKTHMWSLKTSNGNPFQIWFKQLHFPFLNILTKFHFVVFANKDMNVIIGFLHYVWKIKMLLKLTLIFDTF